MLDVRRDLLLPFDASATYYARRLYSVVPSPYGPHGRDGGRVALPSGPWASV